VAEGASDGTFDVSLEVHPLGLVEAVEQTATATNELTGATRSYGEETRRTRTASDDLAAAERRRLQTAADLIRLYKSQIAGLQEVQAQLAKGTTPEGLARATTISAAGVDPSSALGKAIDALMVKEAGLRESIRQTQEVAANVSAMRAGTQELEARVTAARQGIEAERQYAAALELTKAVAATGAAPGSPGAAAAEAEAVAQQKLRAELASIAAARELDVQRTNAQIQAEERLSSVLSSLKSTTSQTQQRAAAERAGAEATALFNRELQVRNALLAAGVAEISAQGELVTINEAGAAAIRSQVAALQAEKVALAEVQAANVAASESGAWRVLGSVLGEIGQALKYMVVYGGLFAAAGLFKAEIAEATQFESRLTQIVNLAGESRQQVEEWRGSLLRLSQETGRGANDLATALYNVASNGQHGAAAMAVLESSAKASAIGLGETATVARAVTAAVNAYASSGLTAAQATDILVATVKEGGVEADRLAPTLGRVVGVAAQVGVSFQQVGAFIATFTRVGVDADEAVTALRGTLAALELKGAGPAGKALASVGYSVQQLRDDIQKNGLAQALIDLVQRFHGNNDALEKVIPNIRALTGVLSVASSQAGSFREVADNIAGSVGHITDEAYALIQQDPGFVFEQMKASVGAAGIALAKDLLPVLVDLAKEVKALVESGALAPWAKAAGIALTVLIDAGKVLAVVLGNLGPILLAYAAWATAAGTASIAFGDAVAFVELRIEALGAAIAANPLGALAVAIVAILVLLNKLGDKMNEVNQRFLDENAAANRDAIALQNLRAEFDNVTAARGRYHAAGGVGSGLIVFTEDPSGFKSQMAAFETAYKMRVELARGDKNAIAAAKAERDKDVAALQDHTQALLDNAAAAIKGEEARLIQLKSMRDDAVARQEAARLDLQSAGINPGKLPTGIKGWAYKTEIEAFKDADSAAVSLNKRLAQQADLLTSDKSKLSLYAGALADSRVAQEKHSVAVESGSKKMENVRLEIEKQIALARVQVADVERLAAATLQGGAAVRQANVDASVAKTLEEDAQRLHKTGVPILQARAEVERTWGRQIRENAEGLSIANQTLAVNGQLFASQQQSQSERLLAWAKLADATGGVTTNTARLSAVLAVYAESERNGLPITDHRVQLLRDEALARIDLQTQVAAAIQASQDNLAFQQEEAAAEAEYQDALTRTTDASREAALQKQILVSLKGKNIAAGGLEARIEEDTIRNHQRSVDSTKALAAAEKLRQDAAIAFQKKQAEYADQAAIRRSNEALGASITAVLEKYGLLSRAVDDLQIKEQAWQLFTTAGNTRTLEAITAELQARRDESRLLDENAAQYEIYRIRVDDSLDALASAFDVLSQGLGGASTAMGKLAGDMGKLVTAIKAVGDAQGRTNKILASAQVAAGIGAALADLHVGASANTGGISALGGRLEGNYAGIGSLVGTIVGAIIGAVLTEGAATGAGAALGGAIGGVLGSLIAKAGDSASASLTASGNVVVGETSRQLDGAVRDALLGIFKGLQAELAKLGLYLQGIPLIDIKVRDNIVRVVVGSVVRTFSSMQDAISFGIAEAVKQAAASGGGHLPPEVLAALARTTATDLQGLQSDLDFAFAIANYGVPKVAQALDKAISDFFVDLQRAAELGIDQTKVIAKFADSIKAQKDQLLGINRNLTPADQLRADVKAFNQKVELLRAQELADQAELAGKKADLAAKIAIARAEIGVGRAVDIAQLESLRITEAALGQIEVALAAAQAVLDSLVTISDRELQDALARLGKGGKGAGAGADGLSSLKQLIDDVAKSVRQSGMTDFQRQLDDLDEKWKKAIADVHVHGDAAARAAKERDEALRAAGKLDKEHAAAAIKAANERYRREIEGIGRTQAALDAANAARAQEIALLKKDLDARVKTFVTTGAPGSGVTSALAGIDETAKGLIADARSLQAAGGQTVRQLHEMVIAINAATAAQREAVKAGVLANVSDFLGGKGPTGLLGKLQQVSDTAKGLAGDLGALAAAGLLSAEALATLTGQITQSAAEQQAAAIQSSAQGLLSDLYGYLGMDKEAAQQKFDIAVAELQARRAELAAALLTAKYTQEAMDNILKPIDALIGKVIAGGPSLFAQGGGAAGAGVTDDRTYAERVAADQAMVAGGAGGTSLADAQRTLRQYLDLGISPMQVEINKVNKDFEALRATLGNTADVQRAYALGMQDILNRYLQPVRDFLKGLNTSELSPLTAVQKFHAAQTAFESAAAAIRGGDLSQLSQIGTLAQGFLSQAQAVLPTGSEAYRTIFREVNQLLNAILTQYGGAQAAVPGALAAGLPTPAPSPVSLGAGSTATLQLQPAGGGTPTNVTVNLHPVTEELRAGNAEQITELKKISKNTGDTRVQVERVAERMDQRWTLFKRAS